MLRWLLLAAAALVHGQVQCPDGYTAPATYTGYCYKYTPSTLTWNGHESVCSSVTLNGQPYAGGHLATIFDQPSATVVMNNYCNGLSQVHGQMNYFIGYFCISSSYTSRTDWRWTSGRSTNWLHTTPAYLSGAEPDDAGCGLAHFSDDGANVGRVGDWACSSARAGGCCEAPVVPTPSPTTTPSNTATATSTQTGTRTQTATNTQTASQTPSNTQSGTNTATTSETRTASKTATESRTATRSSTATSTATSSETATGSASVSQSTTVSPSTSTSSSPSLSISSSASISASSTASSSISITTTPRRPIFAGLSEALVDAEAEAAPATATDKTTVVAAAAGGSAAALAILATLCALWLCCLARKRRTIREQKARAALASKKYNSSKPQIATVAATLGLKGPVKPNALFRNMNPALLTPMTRENKAPRLSMALSAYKSPTSFRPQPIAGQRSALLDYQQANEVEDTVIGIEEKEVEEGERNAGEHIEYIENIHVESVEDSGIVSAGEDNAVEDDTVDEDEDIATALAKKSVARHVATTASIQPRTKKPTDTAASPSTESKKLIIGKGALLQEHVQRQTVQLRRVSKVRGDQQLTALRQQRPSTIARSGFAPQSSTRNLNPYEFTATVSRVIVKADV